MRRLQSINWLVIFAVSLAWIGFYPMCPAAQGGPAPVSAESLLETADAPPGPAGEQPAAEATGAAAEKDAGDWFDQGVLLSVYGNYDAAVRAFQKAVEMAPDWAAAHFQLGVAYGEMGDFPAALAAMDRAIALDPGRGDFYYGRARIYLMTGDSDKALENFEKAAELGSKDAIRYLEK
jgi:tetratricopeptide (TPR) repeat protein